MATATVEPDNFASGVEHSVSPTVTLEHVPNDDKLLRKEDEVHLGLALDDTISPKEVPGSSSNTATTTSNGIAHHHVTDVVGESEQDEHVYLTPETLYKEGFDISKIAAPIVVSYLTGYVTLLSGTLLVGRLGAVELGAAALSNMFCNVAGFSINVGYLSALDTLCSQAYGAKNYKRVGLLLQRALTISTLLAIPVAIVWLFAEQILLAVHQDPEIARLSGVFARWMLPGLLPNFLSEALRRYLQSQGVTMPIFISSTVVMFLSPVLGYLLIYTFGMGFAGAPIATSILNIVFAVGLASYVKWKRLYEETWVDWDWSQIFDMAGWKEIWGLGIPGVLLIGAEWWSFELYALLSGWISVQALATQTILMQTTSLLFMIPLGMAVGTATIVGNRLGARLPLKAAFTVKVSVIGIFILALAFSMGIFGIRNYWGQIFTSDIEVTDSVAKYLPILCIFIISDWSQGTMSGALRGSSRQKHGAIINIVMYYVVGFPIAAFLAFYLEWGLIGLWIGYTLGSFLVAISFGTVLYRSDWAALADAAAAANESHDLPLDSVA